VLYFGGVGGRVRRAVPTMAENMNFAASKTLRLSPVRAALLALAAVALVACSADEAEYVERPVEELYNEAQDFMNAEDYEGAAESFDEVERQHPYSVWAVRAQLMSAYAYYLDNKYDEAIISLDRFIQLHPSNRDIAYAHYLKALCYYEQISDVGRDQKMTRLALESLKELIVRFPSSRYARDAQVKLDLTFDHLAGKEMEIGRYYLRKGQHLAAINRFRNVIEHFQTTTHVPEALHRLTEAYLAIGVVEEAQKAAAVLGHNFPGSDWYIDSYQMVEGKKVEFADAPQSKRRWWWPW
jgi:outer membrane protein assembly factor BamD